MGFGGPVWHVSVQRRDGHRATKAWLRKRARRALFGVGGAREWEDFNPRLGVFHLRRRLSDAEEALTGPALDIRESVEANGRYARVCTETSNHPAVVNAGPY